MKYDEDQLMAIRDQSEEWLAQQRGFACTGIGLDGGGHVCLKIFTDHMAPETKAVIANRLVGVPVDFEETGEFSAS